MLDSALMRPIFLTIAIALYVSASLPTALAAQKIDANQIPFVNPTRLIGDYMLRVPRHGSLNWNGQHIGRARLINYLRQLAAVSDVRLLVAFEPKAPKRRKAWVQKQVIDSTLCKQRRCGEVAWAKRWPGVN